MKIILPFHSFTKRKYRKFIQMWSEKNLPFLVNIQVLMNAQYNCSIMYYVKIPLHVYVDRKIFKYSISHLILYTNICEIHTKTDHMVHIYFIVCY